MNDSTEQRQAGFESLWHRRWWMFGGGVVSIAALSLLRSDLVSDPIGEWHWPLFVWGVAVGVAGALSMRAAFAYGQRRDDPGPERLVSLRHAWVILEWVWIFLGVELGIIASMFDLPWLIVGAAAYLALSLVVAAALVVHKFRKASSVRGPE